MTMQVRLVLDHIQFEALWRIASRTIDTREDGTKAWSFRDKQNTVRKYIQKFATIASAYELDILKEVKK